MWTLTSKKDGRIYYVLNEKEKYVVGRINTDLIIKDDNSISRNHAWLFPSEDHITAVDVGSKYGTFCNENIDNNIPMEKHVNVKLKVGERIQFGALGNEWVLSKLNLFTMISSLSEEKLNALQETLNVLNGKIINSWTESCTHLTMSEITVTVKMLYALVANIPIVSLSFWETYVKNIREGNPPPRPAEYIPSIRESFLNKDTVSFAVNEMRKSIFSGKLFIFMSKKQYDTYQSIITRACGQCKNLSTQIQKKLLVKKNVIVVSHNSMSLSQSSQTIDSISDYLKSEGKRLVPDVEISLAIIYCSTEKYCNPDYITKLVPDTQPSLTGKPAMAPRTQIAATASSPKLAGKVLVPETLCSMWTKTNDDEILSIEIPDTEPAPNRTQNEPFSSNNLDLFGDDVIPSTSQVAGYGPGNGIKRKPSPIPEQPQNKKLHTIREEDDLVKSMEYPSLIPASKSKDLDDDKTIPETETESAKSFAAVERQFTRIDLQGWLDKAAISVLHKKREHDDSFLEEEEAARKRQRFTFSSDENSGDEIIVSWNVPQKTKVNEAKNALRHAYNMEKANEDTKLVERKTPKRTARGKANPPIEVPKIPVAVSKPQKPIVFPSKFKTTDWLSSTNIKKEDIASDSTDSEEKFDKSKADWIDSIKDAFEVRVKTMDLTVRSFRDSSADGSAGDQNNSKSVGGKNFKAFVKKRNYKPQNTIIRTEPMVVMNA